MHTLTKIVIGVVLFTTGLLSIVNGVEIIDGVKLVVGIVANFAGIALLSVEMSKW